MPEIKTNQMDELENLIFELNCITYLLSLAQYDKNCGYILIKEFAFLKGVRRIFDRKTNRYHIRTKWFI